MRNKSQREVGIGKATGQRRHEEAGTRHEGGSEKGSSEGKDEQVSS